MAGLQPVESTLGPARVAALLRAMQDSVVIFDLAGNIVHVNPAGGLPETETRGQSLPAMAALFELRTLDGSPVPLEQWPASRILRGESLTDCVLQMRRRVDGREQIFSFSGEPVRDAHGEVVEAVLVSREITRRERAQAASHRAERALHESEDRLSTILRVALASIAVIRLEDERLIDVNEEWLRQMGWTRDEVIGRTTGELNAYPRDEDRQRIYQRLREDGQLSATEVRFRRKGGEEGDYLVTGGVAVLEGESCAIVVWHDVTALRRADRALRESELQYRLLFEHSPLPKWLYDSETLRFLAVNDAALRQYGYSREEFLAMTVKDIRPSAEVPALVAALPGVLKSSQSLGVWRHRKKDGAIIDVELKGQSFELDGRDRRLIVAQDVTERRRADVALRVSEEKFRQLAENIREVFWIVDVRSKQLTYVSPAFETIWGIPVASVLSDRATWLETIHPGDRERVDRAADARALGTYDEVFRILRPDGSQRWIRERAFPVNSGGAFERIVGIAEDVTELRQAESQLRHAQKMDAVGRLAGGVAHDFNNLLTVILSCADALGRDLEAGRPPELEDVHQINDAGDRAKDLTRQLLAFARKQLLQPIALDLNAILAGSQKLLRRLLGEDVALEVHGAAALWPTQCDPGQVEQVVMNLAVNARDAMPDGGTLTFTTANFDAGAEPPGSGAGPRSGQWVRLAVTDTGCGMSAEVKSHLFEPFFTTKDVGRGTGLGLATVHGVVAQFGGHIDVETAPLQGTTFTLWFPRSLLAAAAVAGVPALLSARGSETVLVIEDDPQVRWVTVRALREAGYRVLEASDGAEALAKSAAHAGALDLVITDVVMPGMNGRAAVEQLHLARPGLPVLYMSGYTREAIADRGVLDSGLRFLAKPFTRKALLNRVRELLEAEAAGTHSLT